MCLKREEQKLLHCNYTKKGGKYKMIFPVPKKEEYVLPPDYFKYTRPFSAEMQDRINKDKSLNKALLIVIAQALVSVLGISGVLTINLSIKLIDKSLWLSLLKSVHSSNFLNSSTPFKPLSNLYISLLILSAISFGFGLVLVIIIVAPTLFRVVSYQVLIGCNNK